MSQNLRAEISAIIVSQWLDEWNKIKFTSEERRSQPPAHFYMFSLPAHQLRKLSKVYRRKTDKPRKEEISIQRQHDPQRSEEIRRFVHGGFPWSELSDRQKISEDYRDLRMPGWLPTAIIANILPPNAKRENKQIELQDIIKINHINDSIASLTLPEGVYDSNWEPSVPPIEIIDGQHRLWAFDGDDELAGSYNLPVVAFYNLDKTWQAYLFYTINIKPKRINASLAFDLYPLLRIQDWLEKSPSGPAIYRETRAQELTEVLWSHPDSPWHKRINLLGDSKSGPVTQAAFIRSLMTSYVKRLEGKGVSIGGLFGAQLDSQYYEILQWARPQQAAFLIFVWQSLAMAVEQCEEVWANHLREIGYQPNLPFLEESPIKDPAFVSGYSLLSTDQGVRGIFQVTNDMCYVGVKALKLTEWAWDQALNEDGIDLKIVSHALEELHAQSVNEFFSTVARELSRFDWRTSSTPGLSRDDQLRQMIFRGSGGYKEIRRQLLMLLASSNEPLVKNIANEVMVRLGYRK